MITIKLLYQQRILTGIDCRGHSLSAEKGQDIICAAVSVLMQSLILGLDDIAKVNGANYEIDSKIPLMRITWPMKESERISLLTHTISESLKQVAIQYPDYVKIYSEVSK